MRSIAAPWAHCCKFTHCGTTCNRDVVSRRSFLGLEHLRGSTQMISSDLLQVFSAADLASGSHCLPSKGRPLRVYDSTVPGVSKYLGKWVQYNLCILYCTCFYVSSGYDKFIVMRSIAAPWAHCCKFTHCGTTCNRDVVSRRSFLGLEHLRGSTQMISSDLLQVFSAADLASGSHCLPSKGRPLRVKLRPGRGAVSQEDRQGPGQLDELPLGTSEGRPDPRWGGSR